MKYVSRSVPLTYYVARDNRTQKLYFFTPSSDKFIPSKKPLKAIRWHQKTWDKVPLAPSPRRGAPQYGHGIRLQLAMVAVDSHSYRVIPKWRFRFHNLNYIAFLPFTTEDQGDASVNRANHRGKRGRMPSCYTILVSFASGSFSNAIRRPHSISDHWRKEWSSGWTKQLKIFIREVYMPSKARQRLTDRVPLLID